MSNITIKNLTFKYDSNPEYVFENLNATLDTNWKTGLVGRNGKGKTTLLKLLADEYEYAGKISASVSFEYFPLTVENQNISVREALYSINDELEEWELLKDLYLLETNEDILDRVYSTLSKGEQTKVLLCALFNKSNSFLLIDEPTNHLDIIGRSALSKFLKSKSGFILISHDRAFLDGCIDHIMSLNRSSVEIQACNMTTYLENKRMRDEFELAQNEKLQKEINRLSESAKRTAEWSNKAESEKFGGKNSAGLRPDRGFLGAKSAKIMKRAKSAQNRIEKTIEEKTTLLSDIDRSDAINVDVAKSSDKRLLSVRDLVAKYSESSVNAPITFEVSNGDRIWLSGKNGSGKSSIIKAILGEVDYEGQIYKDRNLKISYVSQDTSHLSGNINSFCEENKTDKTKLLTLLNKLGIEKTEFDKDIPSLSEGVKKKLLIAKSLCDESNLYIWDEPLNFIDIISRKQIENLILSSGLTMIFIEHDKYFCENIATMQIEL